MYIRVKNRENGKKSVQIVETFRRGTNVHQKILRHVGQAENDREVDVLKQLAQSIIVEIKNEKQPVLPLFAPEDIYCSQKPKAPTDDTVAIKELREEQRIVTGIGEVFGKLYSDLGFDTLLRGTRKNAQWNTILKSCVLARLANPVSKRRTASLLEEDYAIKISLEKIYRMMDHVAEKEETIKKAVGQTTLSLFNQTVDVLFFDVTTLYFESVVKDELRDFGYSKDCKFKETQVTLALVTSTDGLPITYEVFPGNMYEGHTLLKMVKKLKEQYTLATILLVADRAMFTNANLDGMDEEGVNYIVASRLRSLSKDIKEDIISSSDYTAAVVENELHWVKEYANNNRRLIVSYSSERAKKDAADRQRLIDRVMKRVKNKKIKIKDLIPNYGTKKYLDITGGEAVINETKIEQDGKWDGLHGVITNVEEETAANILSRYKGLWQIEEAFRISKHDLKMRPIYHWTPARIKAHITLCFLAYTVAKQAVYRVTSQQMPLSFGQMRNELLHVQSSIVIDRKSRKKYVIPSHTSLNQEKIYRVFGLKRSVVPYAL